MYKSTQILLILFSVVFASCSQNSSRFEVRQSPFPILIPLYDNHGGVYYESAWYGLIIDSVFVDGREVVGSTEGGLGTTFIPKANENNMSSYAITGRVFRSFTSLDANDIRIKDFILPESLSEIEILYRIRYANNLESELRKYVWKNGSSMIFVTKEKED